MSDNEESSVLFSLKELMTLEDDRIKSEEDDKKQAAAQADQKRLDAERQARAEEEARIRADEERRRVEQQRVAEEAARLEAIKHAEVEKARVEAEQRARIEEIARQQEHERQLAALKQDGSKKKLRNALIGGVVVVVFAGAGLGVFLNNKAKEDARTAAVQADEQRKKDEAAAKKLRDAEREIEANRAKLAEYDQQIKDLEEKAKSAGSDAEKAEAEKELAKVRAARGATGAAAGTGGGKKSCRPGDPLCSDLQ